MGFEELFDTRDKHRCTYREKIYAENKRYIDYSGRSSHGEVDQLNWLIILEKIKGNKKLRIYILLAGLLVLSIVIVLILVLLPLIVQLINYIIHNGLQGILDKIKGFVDIILNGTAN